jgi:hypothetical protein
MEFLSLGCGVRARMIILLPLTPSHQRGEAWRFVELREKMSSLSDSSGGNRRSMFARGKFLRQWYSDSENG